MAKSKKSSAALDSLLALTDTSGKAPPKTDIGLPGGSDDQVIRNAKRNKNTVTLGPDPKIEKDARECAELAQALKKAQALFSTKQGVLREYGATKRVAYNDAFRCSVTTVNVPYTVEVPSDDESATPGREARVVQVVCSNKYSVSQDAVLGMREDLGAAYAELFVEEETKVLKTDATDLFKQILKDLGLPEDRVDLTMEVLFDTRTKVTTTDDYEKNHRGLPEDTQSVLNQIVVRQNPGIKFPNS